MDNCSFCSDSQKVFCSDCDKSYCVHCGITHHLSDAIRYHTINYVCEECEEENAVKFCENCDQSLCLTCDTKIHNKGKRAQHVKKDISDTVDLKKIANLAFITATFYDEQFGDDCDAESIKARLSDLINNISNNEADKTKITVLMIESKQNLQENEEEEQLVQAMNELKIKNVILFKDSFEGLGQSSSNGNLVTISAQDNKRASAITFVLKFFDGLECVHIYDTIRNEDLATALGEKTDLKNKKIFVNLDPFDKKDLETSIFEQQPVVLKEKIIQPKFSPQVSEQETQGDYSLLEMKQFSSFKTPSSNQERSSLNSLGFNSNKTSKMWNAYKSGPSKENIEPNQGNFPVLRFPGASEGTNPKSSANSSFSLEGKRLVVAEVQPLHCVDIRGSSRASEVFQRDLIRFASNGELLIPKETVISRLMEIFQLRSIHDATSILMEAEAKKIVHTTSRKFLDNEPIHYIGMLLNTLTIESLVWAIKSIKNDMMTPTEKLVASRVKECYGLKIDQSSWKQILDFIDSKQTPIIDFHTGRAQKTQTYPIQLRQILDPVTNLETGALYLANEDWIPEDQGTVDDSSYEWKSFAMFLEDFFKEEPQSSHDSQEQKAGNVQRWNNSVESVLSRSAYDQEGCLKVTDEIKAIPGGRYGCAQFIKYCGPENLNVLSIGRLTLLVQEALNKGILRYQRTLLVKNTTGENFTNLSGQSGFEAEVLHSLNVERKTKLLSTVKEALLQILMDNPNGIALAQIPSHLKRKLKMNVDFQELGFPKLKNFLSSSTLKNLVVMESVGTNHTNVKLKGPLPRQVHNKLHSNKPNESKRRCGDIDNVPVEPRFTTPRGLEQVNNYINKPTMGNDLWRVTETLDAILKQYPAGISIHELEMRLCGQMKVQQINFKELGYSRFYDYLVDQAEHIAAIEAKKGAFIIYPKANHFWQKGAQQQQQTPPHFGHNHNAPRFGGIAYQEAGRFTDPKVYQNMNMMAHHNNGFNTAGPTRNHHYPGSYNNSVILSDSNNSYLSQNNMSNDRLGKSPNLSSIIASDNKGKVMTPGLARGPRYNGINVACNLNFFNNSVDEEQNGSNWPLSATQKGAKFSNFRVQEESEDDLRFIEELLETGTEKKMMNSFGERSGTLSLGGYFTPNQSFLGKPN